MKRRQFLGVTTVGGAAELLAHPPSPAAAPVQEWRPDGVGSTARIGILTPAFDPVPESEAWAMAPKGVSIHAARVRRQRGEDARLFAEPSRVDSAVESLAAVKPRSIMYAFMSSSYVLGTTGDEALRTRLERVAAGVPVILAAEAASAALHAVGARRVAIIHPPWFTEETNDEGGAYFQGLGFTVVSCARVLPLRDFQEVPPVELHRWAATTVSKEAEAVLIAGNGLRAVGIINALEETLSRPVLTANQVTFWQALSRIDRPPLVTEYGRLFKAAPQ
jgi:maleate isomerase